MKCIKTLVLIAAVAAMCISAIAMQKDDPTKKLGILVGKWETEGTFTGTANKSSSTLECRWSPMGNYLVCEQLVAMMGNQSRQLTVYSYNSKDGSYVYSTYRDPGTSPSGGTVTINGNLWTYSGSFEANGKKMEFRTTNDFSKPGTETFKSETSDDGGAHWKTVLEGSAKKIGD
ncbi:MAG TPA: DUF1579 family protein [Candidatus Angelobacter sp.]|nr:DUF1579 family protein [Candidatus Angelobacter sp.]